MRPARQLRELSNALKAAFDGSIVAPPRVQAGLRRMDRQGIPRGFRSGLRPHADRQIPSTTTFVASSWSWVGENPEVVVEGLHFAPLLPGESLEDSKIRHQRLMISKLQLRPGMTVVDIGCGAVPYRRIPMRRVAREAGVRVVGINSSEVQCNNANRLNAAAGLDDMTDCLLQCPASWT